MTAPALVWLLVAIVSTLVALLVIVGLVRQVLLVGRTAMRFAREAGQVTEDISSAGRGPRTRR